MSSQDGNGRTADFESHASFDSFRSEPPPLGRRRLALVVVDLQYGATHKEYGWLRFHRERGRGDEVADYLRRLDEVVFPNVRRLQEAVRQAGQRVVFLTVASELADHSDRSPAYRRNVARWRAEGLTIPYAVAGSQEAAVREEVAPLSGEPVLVKTTASGFMSSNLDQVLRNWGTEALVFTGVATNFCVESTLRNASDLGFDCVLVEDACAAVNQATHELGVESIRPFAQITTTEAVVAALGQAAGSRQSEEEWS